MTPGTDCDFTLAHPSVNAGAAVGFFLVTERGRKVFAARGARAGRPEALATGGTAYADFGPGPREWRLSVRFEPNGVDYRQAAAGGGTLDQLRELYSLQGAALTLQSPVGETYSVRFMSIEERVHPPDPGTTAEVILLEAL